MITEIRFNVTHDNSWVDIGRVVDILVRIIKLMMNTELVGVSWRNE